MKTLQIEGNVIEIDRDEPGCLWMKIEIDVPEDCERIELAIEDLGPTAYAPPLIYPECGIRKIWLSSHEKSKPTIGSKIPANCFIREVNKVNG